MDEETERFVTITSEPAMPVITITNNQDEPIKGRLKIEYTKNSGGQIVRKWLNHYPEEENGEVKTQTIGAEDNCTIDFGDHIRGGTATYEYVTGNCEWNEGNIQAFVFYIRGNNPTRDEVVNYIENQGYDDQYWFLLKLIRHESGTGASNTFRHFNQGTEFTVNGVNGLPNLGLPRGFGLGQIDNFGRLSLVERNTLNINELEEGETIANNVNTIDWQGYIVASDNQVWNWQENINTSILLLNNKSRELRNHIRQIRNQFNNWNTNNDNDLVETLADQEEGLITFSWVRSEITNFTDYNDIFENPPTDTTKSFYDAILIKYYNGIGAVNPHHYMYSIILSNSKPAIEMERSATFNFNGSETTHYYVELICMELD